MSSILLYKSTIKELHRSAANGNIIPYENIGLTIDNKLKCKKHLFKRT